MGAGVAWSPLAGGWLSGKCSKDAGGPPEGSRSTHNILKLPNFVRRR
jgi:aryl-alcohol dehydrogenase-like predicted oxidoreductase